MKKIALVAAVAAALPVLAQADVNIYGSIRMGAGTAKSSTTGQRTNFVEDYSSRIGFKGSEDLGNGLKAIWQVENGISVDGEKRTSGTGTGTFANRTSFLGLEGSFGKIRAGYVDDVLSDTEAADNFAYAPRGLAEGVAPLYEDLDDRHAHTIRYDSPEWNGFTAIAAYSFGEKRSTDTNKVTGNIRGLQVKYANSGFFGQYAFQQFLNTVDAKNDTVHRFEGGYDANNIYAALSYTKITNAGATDDKKTNFWAATAGYTFGAVTPFVQWSKRNDSTTAGTTATDGATQWALGAHYALSKKTTVGAQYGQVKANAANSKRGTLLEAHVIHGF